MGTNEHHEPPADQFQTVVEFRDEPVSELTDRDPMATRHNGRTMLGPDNAGAVSAYDESFAQSAAAVEQGKPAPDVAAILEESERLVQRIERAAERIERLKKNGATNDQLRRAELNYEALCEKWMRFEADRTGAELRSGEADPFDEFDPHTIGDFLSRNLRTGAVLSEDDRRARLDGWHSLLAWVFNEWNCNPVHAFKHFLAAARRASPQYLFSSGLSQQEVALILGERKATVSIREIKRVERKVRAAGLKGFKIGGNTKSEETRGKCATSAKGNRNRHHGTAKKRAQGR